MQKWPDPARKPTLAHDAWFCRVFSRGAQGRATPVHFLHGPSLVPCRFSYRFSKAARELENTLQNHSRPLRFCTRHAAKLLLTHFKALRATRRARRASWRAHLLVAQVAPTAAATGAAVWLEEPRLLCLAGHLQRVEDLSGLAPQSAKWSRDGRARTPPLVFYVISTYTQAEEPKQSGRHELRAI